MKILLVEDDQDLADMYKLQLKHGGHQVVVADSAQLALDVLDGQTADAILLDLLLPEHNGLSMLYELRSYGDWRKIPVIILSNVNVQEIGLTAAALQSLGVRQYLDKAHTKPTQLLAALDGLTT